jgi:hypothetical protein
VVRVARPHGDLAERGVEFPIGVDRDAEQPHEARLALVAGAAMDRQHLRHHHAAGQRRAHQQQVVDQPPLERQIGEQAGATDQAARLGPRQRQQQRSAGHR